MLKTTNRMKAIQVLTVVFVILLIGMIIVANLGLEPAVLVFINEIPGGDKIGHFILMGLLSLFVNLSVGVKTTSIKSQSFLTGSLIVILIVVVEEFSQLFLRHRGFELLDLLFDTAGIVIFGQLAKVLHNVIF
jgi:hypothetical protein